jgi:diguanylate cyclase (GGDEF)-like protein
VHGDVVLKEVAQALLRGSRAGDVVARYGGEEFVVLLCEARLEQAVVAAERLRTAVKALSFTHPSGSFHVTLSVGITTAAIGESAEPAQFLAEADEALYAAKRLGRDRVECFERR